MQDYAADLLSTIKEVINDLSRRHGLGFFRSPVQIRPAPCPCHPNVVIQHLICNSLPSQIIQGGGQKRLCYISWPKLSHFKSDQSGIKSKCDIHIVRPHVEKKIAKFLKIGRIIAIFLCIKKFTDVLRFIDFEITRFYHNLT